ncbi:PLP-dependent aminotransferase family protein [Roseateles violae]|uniref:PLP-dependent aminotransferase family protein n=1 Tax=Roseateles violae TaxID=3058042 RepID=A0ABT8DS89_9BURK|nr:PLP-dependent aminotransferase family protein [Pelomonas sp. PFR6]MDN3921190.1 PLP-dependent aminotransferase family protein [Pelomonas sp. PFR6]
MSSEGAAALPRYQQLAEELAALMASGALRPGDRLPSVRQTQRARRCSAATVFQAYYLLESRGLIRAAPRSGYFVAPPPSQAPTRSTPRPEPGPVEVSELVFQLLGSSGPAIHAPFGSAFPSAALFPLEKLRRALVAGSRKMSAEQLTADLPAGHEELRRQIALRYLRLGLAITPDEIVLTHGALEALNLSLQLLTRPGDAVLVESPGFYAALQAIERLGLRAIEIPTDAREGADLQALAILLERQQPRACWLMSSWQNPLGSLMPADKKRALLALLARHGVPLIEDDVYAELHFGAQPAPPVKAFEARTTGAAVLHCGSFSKCLAPGYRVGWVAAGRLAPALQRLKLSNSLGGSWPAQAALAEYLQAGGFDLHLRGLRRALQRQRDAMLDGIARHFPAGTRMTRPEGGYFVWLELPPGGDSLALHGQALAEGISLAPGPMFSARREFGRCLRLNYGHRWTPALQAALARLGSLAAAQCKA